MEKYPPGDLSRKAEEERYFRALVVSLILARRTEEAVRLVCERFRVGVPSLGIGIPKGHKKALAVYTVEANAISFADQDQFFDPFVVLHETYHCVRSASGSHRGTEKNADRFALSYIAEYNALVRREQVEDEEKKARRSEPSLQGMIGKKKVVD